MSNNNAATAADKRVIQTNRMTPPGKTSVSIYPAGVPRLERISASAEICSNAQESAAFVRAAWSFRNITRAMLDKKTLLRNTGVKAG
jgi:hypothetical protein